VSIIMSRMKRLLPASFMAAAVATLATLTPLIAQKKTGSIHRRP